MEREGAESERRDEAEAEAEDGAPPTPTVFQSPVPVFGQILLQELRSEEVSTASEESLIYEEDNESFTSPLAPRPYLEVPLPRHLPPYAPYDPQGTEEERERESVEAVSVAVHRVVEESRGGAVGGLGSAPEEAEDVWPPAAPVGPTPPPEEAPLPTSSRLKAKRSFFKRVFGRKRTD